MNLVGPVIEASEVGEAVIAAIRQLNDDVRIESRGAYVRVLVPRWCRLTRAAVEQALDRPFALPGDLERVMPSFAGRFVVNEDSAEWHLGDAGGGS